MTNARVIRIAVPGTPSRKGNWVTAERWAGILRELGHRVLVTGESDPLFEADEAGEADALVALHAAKTFPAIESFHRRHPDRPLVVTLTGTDLYRDVARSEDARRVLRWATRLVVLQPKAFEELGPELREKTRLIRQSVTLPETLADEVSGAESESSGSTAPFDVCVLGHLREVKDPFRAAEASRLLPPESAIRILHAGDALTEEMARRARREERENPRYRWLGDLPRDEALGLLLRSRVLAHTSRLEGGANVMSEALVAGTAVVSSRVDGSVGLLGDDHPALFEVGDTEELASLLRRCETEPDFVHELERRSRERAPLYEPAREVEAWASLLAEILL